MYKENLNDLKHYLIPKLVIILKIIVYLFIGVHMILLSVFMNRGIYLMGVFNIFSVLLYMLLGHNIVVLNNTKKNLIDDLSRFSIICDIALVELYIHMILAVISVGWGANFQVYCFVMIIMIMIDLYLTSTRKRAIIEMLVISVTYGVLKIYTSFVPPLYDSFEPLNNVFDLLNTVLTLVFVSIIIIALSGVILDFEKYLAKKATYDRLTGLANRRYIDKLEYSTVKSCAAILDIDNFKHINDTYGHDAGDEVLKKLSDILRKYEKENDDLTAIRWGGEEFVLVYESKNHMFFTSLMSTIREEVAESLIVSDDYAIKYTITAGVAYAPESCNYKDLIKLADTRLYMGKRNGKNKIVTKG